MDTLPSPLVHRDVDDDDDEESEQEQEAWDDWEDAAASEDDSVCVFCKSRFASPDLVFQHCSSEHSFDFQHLQKELGLCFYDRIRLINYIRSKVACNTCWSCGAVMESEVALHEHLKSENHDGKLASDKRPWQDDKYLTPSVENDPLLYDLNAESDDDADEQELFQDLLAEREKELQRLSLVTAGNGIKSLVDCVTDEGNVSGIGAVQECKPSIESVTQIQGNGFSDHRGKKATDNASPSEKKQQKNKMKVSFAEVAEKERYSINQNYFGSYSTFGIHREMLSDKIRTDAYQDALLKNPSLLKGAVVMDVGCGTSILSLFAAKAGAKTVIAVEGSKRMSLIAQEVVRANGYASEQKEGTSDTKGEIKVIQGMIEELDVASLTGCTKVDVIVSEWMGYCLLFESMLNSVLYARDRWLKPGGAILPDVAKMYAAGFGIGGTSIAFWENVYGFDMKHIGKEIIEESATSPIVDVVDSKDIVTDTCMLQSFDLVTMVDHDVDFTASFELRPITSRDKKYQCIQVYGIVLWFDTDFSRRFCKEHPVVLSTSPYGPKTHWSQTILTFKESVCLTSVAGKDVSQAEAVGTAASPASYLKGRISIVRSTRHRSIDISLEMTAVGSSGICCQRPVQMFDL